MEPLLRALELVDVAEQPERVVIRHAQRVHLEQLDDTLDDVDRLDDHHRRVEGQQPHADGRGRRVDRRRTSPADGLAITCISTILPTDTVGTGGQDAEPGAMLVRLSVPSRSDRVALRRAVGVEDLDLLARLREEDRHDEESMDLGGR